MRINPSAELWNWYLSRFQNNSPLLAGRAISLPTNNASANSDTVTVSRDAKFAQMDNIINSGEPLTGVSYDEYTDYNYWKTENFLCNKEMKQNYNQAVRGTNDVIAKQDWDNENFVITNKMRENPDYQKVVQEQADKWANGEDLTDGEKKILFDDNEKYMSSSCERCLLSYEKHISGLLSENGISLDKDEKIGLSVYGSTFSVTGNVSEEKRTEIENVLNSMTKAQKVGFEVTYMDGVPSYNKNIPRAQQIISDSVGDAEYLLNEFSGGKVKLQDLSIDSSGKIQGLPKELENYFDEISSDLRAPIETDVKSERDEIMSKRVFKQELETAVKIVQTKGYENLPRYSSYFEFSDSKLTMVDNYS